MSIKKQICEFSFPNGGRCKHTVESDKLCIFHSHMRVGVGFEKRFWWRIKRLVMKGDGDWRGFIFPTVNLEQVECKIPIDVSFAEFYSVSLNQCIFADTVDATGTAPSILNMRLCTFKKQLIIKEGKYGKVKLVSIKVHEDLIANDSIFTDNFLISGAIGKVANFSRCHFEKKATFVQTKTVTFSTNTGEYKLEGQIIRQKHNSASDNISVIEKLKFYCSAVFESAVGFVVRNWKIMHELITRGYKGSERWVGNKVKELRLRFPHGRENVEVYVLFNNRAILDEMTFAEPRNITFRGVRLSEASFYQTDLRSVNFIGNDWFQPELKRDGLYDELRYHQTTEYFSKKEMLPNIENACRNIRYSLEEIKDFGLANVFFIGEMDAKRRQLVWWKRWFVSVPALYRLISNYGTSPSRVAFWFLGVTLTHMWLVLNVTSANTSVSVSMHTLQNFDWNAPFDSFTAWLTSINVKSFIDSFTYSLQTMTLQKDKIVLFTDNDIKNTSLSFINAIFTIVGPVIIGLFALTVRTRIKRN